MPGYEVIGKEELKEISILFNKSKTLSRMGFENRRKGIFKVQEFEKNFSRKIKTRFALAVSSGTAALRVALATLNLKENDEVITQSFTFVATAEAIIESRAKPVFTEIDKTLNMDPTDLIKKINKNTKAVIVVHMLGVPAKIDIIKKICKKYKIFLIEDTAWGCGAKLKNKFLGTWGDVGAFSFDFAKTITTGEGGMLVFKDKKKFDLAKAWHDHGHENNPKYERWEDTRKKSGFNFRMSELQGAIGIVQLKKLNYVLSNQRKNYNLIWNKIKTLNNIEKRELPVSSKITADALIIFVESLKLARICRAELLKNKISTKILPEAYSWHFALSWRHIKNLSFNNKDLVKSKTILSRALSIPIFVNMNKNIPEIIYKSLAKVINKN